MAAKIAVIGNRKINEWLESQIFKIGADIVRKGGIVVSGGAEGTDSAAIAGGNHIDPSKVHVYIPWASYSYGGLDPRNQITVPYSFFDHPHSIFYLEEYYKKPIGEIQESIQKLMARNMAIINNADVVIAFPGYSKNRPIGGTAFGIWYAAQMDKPTKVLDKDTAWDRWDVCPDCGVSRSFYTCGSHYHSLKPYSGE